MLVAIASQNSFALVFYGASHKYCAICCEMKYRMDLDGQNRQSPIASDLDRGLESQPFSQFCCIGMFNMNRQSRVSNRSLELQGRQRFESRVFKSLAIGDPRGPKDQKNSRFRAGVKISSENEIFERATHHGPIFCGEIETSRLKFSSEIKNFDRDQKYRSGSNFFDRWALWVWRSRDFAHLSAWMSLCETNYQGSREGVAPFWGAANLPGKVSRDVTSCGVSER